jgi:bla regulator protein blaR1
MMEYIIKVILCSGLFLTVYLLQLQNENMYRFNRIYLLVTAVLSLIIPCIVISHTVEYVSMPVAAIPAVTDETAAGRYIMSYAAAPAANYWLLPALFVYGLVSLLLLIRFVINLASIVRSTAIHERVRHNNAVIVLINSVSQPYSFLRFIFINKDQWHSGGMEPQVLQHECTHVRQLHTVDILFTELLLVCCWINPFFFLYRKYIRLNHEYLADEGVLSHFSDTAAYQYLLVQHAQQQPASALASPFNYLTVKKRIIMMTAKTTAFKKYVKCFQAAAVVIAALFTFGTNAYTQKVQPGKELPDQQPSQQPADTGKARLNASLAPLKENLPFGPGATEAMMHEYDAIINKYKNTDQKWGQHFFNAVSEADKSRLEEIYLQMNKEQRSVQTVIFRAPFPPMAKIVPSAAQFESFKNTKVYGVWIDDKKVSNDVLKNYVHTGFSQVFVSKLYGAAKKGKNYTHQVNLMTNAYYRDYYNKTIANRKNAMLVWWQKK